jgi:ABC-2 type transport system permease protein
MKKLLAYFRISVTDTLEYRGDVFLFTVSGVILPVTTLLLWTAVGTSGSNAPLSQSEFVNYYLFMLVVGLWVSQWASYFISRDIRLGKISPWLLKPAPYALYQITNNLSEKILKSVYLIPIIFILAKVFEFSLPQLALVNWILFVISVILAGGIAFFIDLCLGFLAFWIGDSSAVRETFSVLHAVFSGRLVPLYVLPVGLLRLSYFLPFRYILSLPLEIILNKLSNRELFLGLSAQLILLILGYLLYKSLWRRGTKRYSAFGN